MVLDAKAKLQIQAEVLGLKGAERQVEGHLKRMNGRVQFYEGLIQVRMGQMMLAVSGAIVGAIGASVKTFAEFDQSLRNTQAITGQTAEGMLEIRDAAQRLGTEGPLGPTAVSDAMLNLAKNGLSVNEIIQASGPIMKLAVAQGEDMAKVSDLMTTSIRSFGLDFTDAAAVADVFAAATAKSRLDITKLQQSLKFLGPVARQFGIDISETSAVLALLADQGIQAGKAGRSLRRIFQGTVKQTDQSRAVLKALKLEFQDIDIKTRGFTQVMDTLSEAGIDAGQIFKLFGLRASDSAAAISLSNKTLAQYTQEIREVGILQKQFDVQMKGLTNRFKKLQANVENLRLELGEELGDAVGQIIDKTTTLVKWFADLDDRVQASILNTALFSAGVLALAGVFIITIGTLTQATLTFGGLFALIKKTHVVMVTFAVKAVGFLTLAMWKLVDPHLALAIAFKKQMFNMSRGTLTMRGYGIAVGNVAKQMGILVLRFAFFTLAAAAVILVLIAITLWYDEIKKFTKDVIDATFDLGKEFVDLALNTFKPFLDVGEKVIDFFINLAKLMGDALPESVKQFARDFASDTKKAFEGFINETIPDVVDATKEGAQEAFGIWAEKATALFDKLKLQFPEVTKHIEALTNALGTTRDAIGDVEDAAESDFATLMRVGSNVTGTFDEFSARISSSWSTAIQGMIKGTTTWGDVFKSVQERVLDIFINTLVDAMLKTWLEGLVKMVFAYENTVGAIGSSIGSGGIFSLIGKIIGLGGSIAGGGNFTPGGDPAMSLSGGGLGDVAGSPLFTPMAHGGIVTSPTRALVGEAGPEAIIPLSQLGGNKKDITIINVIDPSFVPASLQNQPGVIVNIITQDIIANGSTRRVIRDVAV